MCVVASQEVPLGFPCQDNSCHLLHPVHKSSPKQVGNLFMSITLAQFRAVVTADYLATIGGADLFTREVVGNVYSLGAPRHSDPTDLKSSIMLEVRCKERTMTWFINNLLKYARESTTGVDFLHMIRGANKVPHIFTVIDFQAVNSTSGLPRYSRKLVDFSKVRKLYPVVSEVLDDPDSEWQARNTAYETVARNIALCAVDEFVKNGKITDEAESQFRLGRLLIRVDEYMS